MRVERDFSRRDEFERNWLVENTWCDDCDQADLGLRDPIEYEEGGSVYVEGACRRCGATIRSTIDETQTPS